MARDLGVVTFGATAKCWVSLPLCFHAPNRDFEVPHLKSRNGPNVGAVECNHHWATLDAAYPMRAASSRACKRSEVRARRRRMPV